MKTFDINRFFQVVKWDFAINRPFYTKAALLIFFCMSLPLFITLLLSLGIKVFSDTDISPTSLVDCCSYIVVQMIFVYTTTIACGYTFHNLLTRQSRIMELMLPASNIEKFCCHALVTILGVFVVGIASFFVIDFAHMAYLKVFDVEVVSMTYACFKDLKETIELANDVSWMPWMHVVAFAVLGFIINNSFYVLGNAIKYRYNIILTMIAEQVFGFIFSIFFFLLIACTSGQILEPFSLFPDWLELSMAYAVCVGIIVVTWWLSFRFYKHAQITTRRNK